ncbi:MAG: sensor histidine kinase [Myxococcota bacterium]
MIPFRGAASHLRSAGGRSVEKPSTADAAETLADRALEELCALLPVERAAVLLFENTWDATRTLASRPRVASRGAAHRDRGRGGWDQSGAIVTLPLVSGGRRLGLLTFTLTDPDAYGPEMRADCRRMATELAEALDGTFEAAAGNAFEAEVEQRVHERTAELERRLTELQSTNARLSEQNTELEALAQSLSHDLVSPVRTIRSAAEALVHASDGIPGEPRLRQHAWRVEQTSQRLERLVDDLVAYSRLGRMEERLLPLDLGEVVDEAFAQLASEIEQTGAHVEVVGRLPQVRGHHATLVQAVMNLVGNAIKFVPAGVTPRVRIHGVVGRRRGGLRVQDNGIGIAPEHLSRVFRVFERLQGDDQYPGSGLGLAIVQRGIKRLGGRVGADSTPGQGSTFWIELPLA